MCLYVWKPSQLWPRPLSLMTENYGVLLVPWEFRFCFLSRCIIRDICTTCITIQCLFPLHRIMCLLHICKKVNYISVLPLHLYLFLKSNLAVFTTCSVKQLHRVSAHMCTRRNKGVNWKRKYTILNDNFYFIQR